MPSSPKPRLFGISGSLRKNSYCTSVLAILADAIADRAALAIVSLDRMPVHNHDSPITLAERSSVTLVRLVTFCQQTSNITALNTQPIEP
jgi:NAD(P)H-dependent FMN reductase